MLILVCGVGRAGKTTFSQRFKGVIHSDGMGHIPHRFANVINALTDGDVVVEGIYESAELRTELCQAYKGNGKRCIWLDSPKDTVIGRARATHIPISESHFRFDFPTYSEGWDEIITIRSDSYA